MAVVEQLFIESNASLACDDEGKHHIQTSSRYIPLGKLTTGAEKAIAALVESEHRLDDLFDIVEGYDGFAAIPHFSFVLDHITRSGVVQKSYWMDNHRLFTVEPYCEVDEDENRVVADVSFVLSRFSYVRTVDGLLFLESPHTQSRVCIEDSRIVSLIMTLAKPSCLSDLMKVSASLSAECVLGILSLLNTLKFIHPENESGDDAENSNQYLRGWEFHDLLFHARSRMGRHHNGFGGTYRLVDELPKPPILNARLSEDVIELPKPDLESIKLRDESFTAVLEGRTSISDYALEGLSFEQLSEFLFRAARIKGITRGEHGEVTSRPYPGGGGVYELELYPVIHNCKGVDSGLYQYRPQAHELCCITKNKDYIAGFLSDAQNALAQGTYPPVLFLIAARFSRVNWKYESMAYALILKNFGVLLQTMYLVATAMGLAPCAIGGGNSEQFARVSGLNFLEEGTVGEFALGIPVVDSAEGEA